MEKEIVKVKGEILADELYHVGSTATYNGEVYEMISRQRTDGDGEWYQHIVQRQSDKKFFAFDWGYGDTRNYYEDDLYEVTPKETVKYE